MNSEKRGDRSNGVLLLFLLYTEVRVGIALFRNANGYRHASMQEDVLLGIRYTGVYCNLDYNF